MVLGSIIIFFTAETQRSQKKTVSFTNSLRPLRLCGEAVFYESSFTVWDSL
jgi:hypothetical protein